SFAPPPTRAAMTALDVVPAGGGLGAPRRARPDGGAARGRAHPGPSPDSYGLPRPPPPGGGGGAGGAGARRAPVRRDPGGPAAADRTKSGWRRTRQPAGRWSGSESRV